MRLWKRRTPFTLILVAALLLLLPVLAFLQYKWLGQVSQAERDRMKSNLHASAVQFAEDFDRELTRVYFHFQSEADSTKNAITKASSKLAEWRTRASFPKLVENLYWVDWENDRGSHLRVINEDGRDPDLVEWPSTFDHFRTVLKTAPQPALPRPFNMLVEPGPTPADGKGSRVIVRSTESLLSLKPKGPDQKGVASDPLADAIAGLGPSAALVPGLMERVIEDAPALIIPVFFRDEQARNPGVARIRLGGFLIAKLNDQELKADLLTALANKHFGSKNGFEYQLIVASNSDPKRVVYRSNESLDAARMAANSDESVGLFAVRPELNRTFFVSRSLDTAQASPSAKSDHLAVRIITGKDQQRPNALYFSEIEGYWKASLKHRSGSLEAAVGSVRRRTLGISFGILLLLGASIILLVLSTRRAQRLAEQQMEFVAGVSHELRTPLAVIRSAAENLADGFVGDREQVQKYGALIRDEGRRLSSMVEQVLEVASAQSGKQVYQMRPISVAQIIEDAINACSSQLREGGFTLDQHIESGLPLISADARAVSRAIENLISNAMKYSGESRWIGLNAVKGPDDSHVIISVSDRGIGISPSDIDHIFDPFFRERKVLEAQIHGSGLGLSLVKHIIESHSGSITVDSTASGTMFRVTLPALKDQQAVLLQPEYEQTNPAR